MTTINPTKLAPLYLPASLTAITVSHLYPPDMVAALLDVKHWPAQQRNTRINTLTAELHRRGLVRDPADDSRAHTWAALRHTPTFTTQAQA